MDHNEEIILAEGLEWTPSQHLIKWQATEHELLFFVSATEAAGADLEGDVNEAGCIEFHTIDADVHFCDAEDIAYLFARLAELSKQHVPSRFRRATGSNQEE